MSSFHSGYKIGITETRSCSRKQPVPKGEGARTPPWLEKAPHKIANGGDSVVSTEYH